VAGNSLRVPHFIQARSPSGLRNLCMKQNLKDGKEYSYFSIQFVNGNWIAWFFKEAEISIPTNEIKNGTVSSND
jgi:hypothetical protein